MGLENLKIGKNFKPFIVAEMSGNHNKSLQRALDIVDKAAEAGVDAIKLQTYTPDSMTLNLKDKDFFIEDNSSLWKGQSLYDLYAQASTPWEWHAPIFERAKKLGLLAFSSPFDSKAVDFLEAFDVPMYKLASFEIVDLELIKKIASTGKPIIISTGMASVSEIMEAITTARKYGCNSIVVLKCTSSYPASPKNSNIKTIPHLRDLTGCEIGLSDHTLGIGVAVASVALGAVFIEKHFTLNRSEGGVDSEFSLEPNEMKLLVEESKRAYDSLGYIKYGFSGESEEKSIAFRRSLYIAEDMKEGEEFSEKNLRVIRPGYGLAPRYLRVLLGKKVKHSVKKGTAVTWDLI